MREEKEEKKGDTISLGFGFLVLIFLGISPRQGKSKNLPEVGAGSRYGADRAWLLQVGQDFLFCPLLYFDSKRGRMYKYTRSMTARCFYIQ
jgi:hypothetical protein